MVSQKLGRVEEDPVKHDQLRLWNCKSKAKLLESWEDIIKADYKTKTSTDEVEEELEENSGV